MSRLALALLLLAAAAGQARSTDAPWPGAVPVAVEAEPAEIAPARLTGLEPLGAWVLRAGNDDFGGLSGLLVEPGRLLALTDRGAWLTAEFVAEGRDLAISDAALAPMRGPGGELLEGAAADAEGLARLGDRLWVGFERDHRLAPVLAGGAFGEALALRAFERLPSNGGLEALASAGDALLAIGEEEVGGGPPPGPGTGFPVFAFDGDGTPLAETRLPARSRHGITGADIGPDGRLHTVQRHFTPLTGVSIRVVRYDLAGDPPLPVAESATVLGAWESGSGIDNMEAIALWRDAEGRTRLWLLSDDNFNFVQRTLLMDFALLE